MFMTLKKHMLAASVSVAALLPLSAAAQEATFSLAEFNRRWARRVLTGNAATLLVTDGLDRDEHGELGAEAARLSRYSRELLWLNPLLRFDGFEPRAAGIRAILPHVDDFLPVHNVASLTELAAALDARRVRRAPRANAHPHRSSR